MLSDAKPVGPVGVTVVVHGRLDAPPCDAVATAVAARGFTVTRLAVSEIPRSGTPDELVDHYGISARHIVAAVRS